MPRPCKNNSLPPRFVRVSSRIEVVSVPRTPNSTDDADQETFAGNPALEVKFMLAKTVTAASSTANGQSQVSFTNLTAKRSPSRDCCASSLANSQSSLPARLRPPQSASFAESWIYCEEGRYRSQSYRLHLTGAAAWQLNAAVRVVIRDGVRVTPSCVGSSRSLKKRL